MTKRMQILKIVCAGVVLCMTAIVTFAGSTLAVSTAADNSTKIAVGSKHSLMIDPGGNVWALGDNEFGQLGDGSTLAQSTPFKVYSSTWKGKAISVAAGLTQSLVLLQNGTVLQWGNSSLTQKPIAFVDGRAVAIFAGGQICMAILDNGNAVVWSDNYSQQINVRNEYGDLLDNITEISIGSNEFMILKTSENGGTVYQITDPINPVARKVMVFSRSEITYDIAADSTPSDLYDAVKIAAGRDFGTAILSNGDVYTWGNADFDGISVQGYGVEYFEERAKKVTFTGFTPSKFSRFLSSGSDFTIIGGDNNDFYGWGNSFSNKLDKTKSDFYFIPVSLNLGAGKISQLYCGESYSMALSSDGGYYIWGEGNPLQKLVFKENLAKVATPALSSSFISKNSMTISWNPADYHTEMAIGYSITYKMPSGEETRTQILPLTQNQITLQSLQPATNYSVSLTIYGKTGFNQTFPAAIVQTLKPDAVTLTPTPVPTVTVTKAALSTSSDVSEGEKDNMTSVLGIIIVILIFLLLALAVAAIIFVWKKIEKQEKPGAKSIRIPVIERVDDDGELNDDEQSGNYDEQADDKHNADDTVLGGVGDEDDDVKIAASPAGKKNIGKIIAAGPAAGESSIYTDSSEMDFVEPQSELSNSESPVFDDQVVSEYQPDENIESKDDYDEIPEEDFIVRHPKAHETDDDDDFIIRKP